MSLWSLYFAFCSIGIFTFGGGYAMLPLFQHLLVEETGLISPQDFSNLTVLSQLTPGAIGINMATFIGYHQHGVTGALVGTLGMITPALLLTTIVAYFLEKFHRAKIVAAVLTGINPAVFGLIVSALLFFAQNSLLQKEFRDGVNFSSGESANWLTSIDWRNLLIFGGALILAKTTKLGVPVILLLAAIAGMAIHS